MDWRKIKAEYLAGGTSYRKLALKHNVKLSALRSIAKREDWVDLKTQTQHKLSTKLTESVSDQETKKAVDIIHVADKLLDKITEFIETVPLSANSVKQLTSAIKDIKEIKGIKSDADSREQEARIKALEKQVQNESPKDREINVNFEGDLSLYSK